MPSFPKDSEATEAPMHPSLSERVRQLARQHAAETRELEMRGRAIVLCPPNCPQAARRTEHAHTWWDMWRMRKQAEYEAGLQSAQRAAETSARVDVVAHLRRAGVGEIHVQGLAGPLDEDRPTLRAVRAWLAQPRPLLAPDYKHPTPRTGPLPHPWLMLMGLPDAGKTQAAVVALADAVRRYPWNQTAGGGRPPLPVLFVPSADVAGLDAFSDVGRTRVEDMRRCGLLVLDDLGSERLGDVPLGLLHDVLDTRYRELRRTVITTHLSRRDWLARFDGWRPKQCTWAEEQSSPCTVEALVGWNRCERHLSRPGADRVEPGRLERRLRELAYVLQSGGRSPSLSASGSELWATKKRGTP